MESLIALVPLLACPLGMAACMLLMRRRERHASATPVQQRAEELPMESRDLEAQRGSPAAPHP
jgi:hypothetical protein